MIRTTISFHNRSMRGERPVIYCLIHTDLGYRAYAHKELAKIFEIDDLILLDGSWLLDGSKLMGTGLGLLDKQGRVLDFGSFERTIQPRKKDFLNSYDSKSLQHATVLMDNRDRYFSRMLPKEPFLTKEISIYAGFEADPMAEAVQLFGGRITEIGIGPTLRVEADEQ